MCGVSHNTMHISLHVDVIDLSKHPKHFDIGDCGFNIMSISMNKYVFYKKKVSPYHFIGITIWASVPPHSSLFVMVELGDLVWEAWEIIPHNLGSISGQVQ